VPLVLGENVPYWGRSSTTVENKGFGRENVLRCLICQNVRTLCLEPKTSNTTNEYAGACG